MLGIPKKWSSFTKENVKRIKDIYGVYEIADKYKNVIYVGQGKLRSRLMSHFLNGLDPIPGAAYFRAMPTGNKAKAVRKERSILKEYLKRFNKLPKYNDRVG